MHVDQFYMTKSQKFVMKHMSKVVSPTNNLSYKFSLAEVEFTVTLIAVGYAVCVLGLRGSRD